MAVLRVKLPQHLDQEVDASKVLLWHGRLLVIDDRPVFFAKFARRIRYEFVQLLSQLLRLRTLAIAPD